MQFQTKAPKKKEIENCCWLILDFTMVISSCASLADAGQLQMIPGKLRVIHVGGYLLFVCLFYQTECTLKLI